MIPRREGVSECLTNLGEVKIKLVEESVKVGSGEETSILSQWEEDPPRRFWPRRGDIKMRSGDGI